MKMLITKTRLKQIIKEEVNAFLKEQNGSFSSEINTLSPKETAEFLRLASPPKVLQVPDKEQVVEVHGMGDPSGGPSSDPSSKIADELVDFLNTLSESEQPDVNMVKRFFSKLADRIDSEETGESKENLARATIQKIKDRIGRETRGTKAIIAGLLASALSQGTDIFNHINVIADDPESAIEMMATDSKPRMTFAVSDGPPDLSQVQAYDFYGNINAEAFDDLTNDETVEVLWNHIDQLVDSGRLNYRRAHVTTQAPGGIAYIDYDQIPDNLVMPNSFDTKEQYKEWVIENILKNDVKNISDLRDFVFGDTGKWPSNSGDIEMRYADLPGGDEDLQAQVIALEWSVAYNLYQEIVEDGINKVVSDYQRQPEATLIANGVESEEQLLKILNKILYGAGIQKIDSLTSPQ